MMPAGQTAGLWLLHFAILAIVDTKLFKTPPAEGEKNVGMLVWGIIGLVIFGGCALEGAYGLITSIGGLQWIGEMPFLIISGLFANMAQVALSVFMILSNVNRVRQRAPKFGVLKVILGASAAFFAILLFVASLMNFSYFY